MSTVFKDTNPKDAVGIRKAPFSTVSAPVLTEVGIAMLEGARKYGRHNYRVAAVRASVYYDAAFRHLTQWYEGEDLDPDSGLSHVTKAIAGLIVLRDAMIQDKLVDDRPPKSPDGWMRNLQPVIDEIFNKYPDAKEAYTHVSTHTSPPNYIPACARQSIEDKRAELEAASPEPDSIFRKARHDSDGSCSCFECP